MLRRLWPLVLWPWLVGALSCDKVQLASLCKACACSDTFLTCHRLPDHPALLNALRCDRREVRLGEEVAVVPWEAVAGSGGRRLSALRLSAPLACHCDNEWLRRLLFSLPLPHSQLMTSAHSRKERLMKPIFADRWTENCTDALCSLSSAELFHLPDKISFERSAETNCTPCDTGWIRSSSSEDSVSCEASGDGCLGALFVPAHAPPFAEAARVPRPDVEGPDGCPRKASLSLDGRTAEDAGWLLCRGRPEHAVAAVAVQPPSAPRLFVSSERYHTDDHFDIVVRAQPLPTSLRWFFHSRPKEEWRPKETWEVLLETGGGGSAQRFSVSEDLAGSLDNAWSVARVKVRFLHPEVSCTHGNYTARACNALGCGEAELSVDTRRHGGATCAVPNVTITVVAGAEGWLGAKEPKGALDEEPRRTEVLSSWESTLLSVAVALGALGVLLLAHITQRRRRHRKRRHKTSAQREKGTELTAMTMGAANEVYVQWLRSVAEAKKIPVIPSTQLRTIRQLGEGAFGQVFLVSRRRASVSFSNLNRSSFPMDESYISCSELGGAGSTASSTRPLITPGVSIINDAPGLPCGSDEFLAMKQLRCPLPSALKTLETEAETLARLSHPNIVRFVGFVSAPEHKFGLLFEHMEGGDLLTHLRAASPDPLLGNFTGECLSVAELAGYCRDVAAGLEYLGEVGVLHRDLAARNCLVSAPPRVVKISDFGMSKEVLGGSEYYKVGAEALIPLRWLPPESAKYRRFTRATDAFAMGVLFWETFAFGATPWGHLANGEVLQAICSGATLARPDACPEELFNAVLRPAWHPQPDKRLLPRDARNVLEEFLQKTHAQTP